MGFLSSSDKQGQVRSAWALKDLFHPWSNWVLRGILSHVYSSRSQFAALGISWEAIQTELVARHPHTDSDLLYRKSQRVALSVLEKRQGGNALHRIRSKLGRWKIPGLPRSTASRVL